MRPDLRCAGCGRRPAGRSANSPGYAASLCPGPAGNRVRLAPDDRHRTAIRFSPRCKAARAILRGEQIGQPGGISGGCPVPGHRLAQGRDPRRGAILVGEQGAQQGRKRIGIGEDADVTSSRAGTASSWRPPLPRSDRAVERGIDQHQGAHSIGMAQRKLGRRAAAEAVRDYMLAGTSRRDHRGEPLGLADPVVARL